ncbi:Fic family protein [Holdemanella biformis]|uniref:Fic family protein n=1 Tax=Holdemanella biformis TaxID=1735 RepID=UPI001C386B18|nr:Fic family protein [Holdemanella biformis]MBV4132034.1 Fic family protein [Holdemanella biformis]MBV4151785.1 Fic family protein [Holdemanella biformis]MEE0667733.1 Fic family protein [Holdemanella biformis]
MEYELLSKIFYKKPTEYESIYDARFNSEASIKLPIKIHENVGFIFNTNEITKLLVKIYKTINKINLLRTHLPNIAINSYIIKSLKDEIALTNEIEGVRSTRKEIEDAIDSIKNDKSARFKGLVDKYFKLISNEIIPLNNCEDIRTIYDALVLPEIEKENLPDGILFRKEPVQVVSATQKEKHRGIMPESKIIESLDLCLDFLKNDDIDSLIKISAFHYLFGYIHPFYDGNGRTSRFISSYLIKNELDILLALKLSYTVKNNINKYYKAFDVCNDRKNKGDITFFVVTFLELLSQASDDLYTKIADLNDQLNYYNNIINTLVNEKVLNDKQAKCIFILCQNRLFDDTYMNMNTLTELLEKSDTTTRKILKSLESKNLLVKSRNKNQYLYSANLDSLSSQNFTKCFD